MNFRLSHILVVLGALVAFLPVLAVDYLLDNYIREREHTRILGEATSLTNEAQNAVYSGAAAIRNILNDSPSLCTQTFLHNVHKQLQSNIYLRQVLVENFDGVQYCDAYGDAVSYSVLSRGLTIPGNAESISVVRFATDEIASLKITQFVGDNRTVSAFVYISPRLGSSPPIELADADLLRFELTDGTDIITYGDTQLLGDHSEGKYVHVQAIADALPLIIKVVMPFDVLRASYASLDVGITIIAAMMSAAFLVLAFHYVRQARLPAFDLERAIENGELKPYYQPVMNISSGRIAGCEVLIRWEKKNGEVISPNMFIDYAEATGLAIPMTIRLMEQVRTDLSDLCEEIEGIKIGINLFDGHFHDTSIVEDVQAIFEDSPISYRQLVFEITERRPLKDYLATTKVIAGLHALGCRLALDDAGTGHSNLENIHKLGVDIIKIDKVFVDMIVPGVESVPVLDGLINMALDMGSDIVAEGIETEAQALYLRSHGIVEAQGFLFAPALPPESFISLVQALNDIPVEKNAASDDKETAASDEAAMAEEVAEEDATEEATAEVETETEAEPEAEVEAKTEAETEDGAKEALDGESEASDQTEEAKETAVSDGEAA